MYLLVIFLGIVKLALVQTDSDQCAAYKTCGQCIGNDLKCVWCLDVNHNGSRCASSSQLKSSWCSSIINPKTQKPEMIMNKELRSEKPGQVQLKPQHVALKVRLGDTVKFKVNYRPAQDYPIDIYYLFDNSFTMKDHKDELVQQAEDMRRELMKKSNNVRFGAGSFIEKLALPYASEAAGHKLNTFNNHVSLTENITEFVNIVQKVTYSSNYDDPEAGLDGLMQVMVCNKEIDWRNNSRRMIIYLTDATYHSAGDGKIVGAYKPNDMQCHLVPTPGEKFTSHVYEKKAALTYDYPSVSQINKIASQENFNILFTTLKKVSKEYEALAQSIKKAHHFELKEIPKNNTGEGGSDLVKFISDEYQKLLRTVGFDVVVPPYISMTLDPTCSPVECSIRYNGTLIVESIIKVLTCPSVDKSTNTVTITPTKLPESLKIDIEAFCQCECEKEGNGEINSLKCSYNGTYQCGICKCNNDRYGEKCECEGNSTPELDQQLCKASPNDTYACSGRGNCHCGGICECWPGYDGAQCQFRMDECPTFQNKVCANQGKCEQNKCKCFTGWTGTDCSCSTKIEICVGANSQVCSGNGNCKCGVCECTKLDKSYHLYRGKYCDYYDTYIEDRCKELGDYVKCNFNGEKAECDQKFNIINYRTVIIKNETEVSKWREGNRCIKLLDDKSGIVFKYLDGNNSTEIWIQKEKELPPEVNYWVACGTAIGVILLIGILTLIAWKILVDIHDSREYRKFKEESKAAGFEVSNPIYNPPATVIQNPAYTGHN